MPDTAFSSCMAVTLPKTYQTFKQNIKCPIQGNANFISPHIEFDKYEAVRSRLICALEWPDQRTSELCSHSRRVSCLSLVH